MNSVKRLSGDLKEYQVEVIQKIIEISKLNKTDFYRLAIDSYLIQQKERLEEVGVILPKELLEIVNKVELLSIPLPAMGNHKKRSK